MTVYYQTIVINYNIGNTGISQNVTTSDTISAYIDASLIAAGLISVNSSSNCVVTPSTGINDGDTVTISFSGSTAGSWYAQFRTFDSDSSSYRYGRIYGVVSTSGPSYSVTGNTAAEGGGAVTFTTTTANVADGTTLYWTIDGASADVTPYSGSFTINSNTGSFSTSAIADLTTEGTEYYTVNVRTGSTTGTIVASSTLTITDNSTTPSPTYSLNNVTSNEGVNATFTITTTNVPNGTVVNWFTNATTSDVSTTSGQATINSNTATFSVPIINDSLTEGTEQYTVYVYDASWVNLLASSTLTINDTSTTPASPTYSVANASTNEGASATVNVTTTNVSNGTVLYWTVNATTADVSTTSGSFTVNSNAGSFTIPAVADSTTEGTETYTISIRTGSTSGTVVATSTLTIYDTSTTPADTTPDQFTFTDQTNVALSTTITSNTITVSGINAAATISVVGGTYSINGGAYTSSSGTITNGQTVSVRHTSSASYSTATNTTLTIGGISDIFTSTTLAADTTPDQFSFVDKSNVALSSLITSDPIFISGIDAAATISIAGGTYNIDGGAYTSSSGTITNGQSVTVQHTSASTNNTSTNTTLTVGGISDTFTSTTLGTASSFYFVNKTDASLNTYYTDNTTVSGLTPNSIVTVNASGGTVDATTALPFSGIYASSKTVTVSSTGTIIVSAKVLSASTTGTTNTCTITIGANSGTFSVTTYAAGTRADQFYFTDVTNATLGATYTSNSITIAGLSGTATLYVTGGLYSLNGGAFVNTSTTVSNGNTIRVQAAASTLYNTSNSVRLDISASGGYTSDTFDIKTPEFLYSMSPYFISLYEGNSINVTVESTVITSGTLYWTIDGATTSDFNAVSGSITMSGGKGTFNIAVKTDAIVEGTETYAISIRTGSTAGTIVHSGTILVTDPPSSSYGMQLFDTEGNIVLDTNTYTVKESKYTTEVTSATTLSVPVITNSTIAQVVATSGSDTTNVIESVSLDYVNKLLTVTGSSFTATVTLLDYR